MSDEAVKLARAIVAPWNANSTSAIHALARAVLAQAEELAKLRADNDALQGALKTVSENVQSALKAEYRELRESLVAADQTVAELRAALREALDGAFDRQLDAVRFLELRRLADDRS